MKKYEWLVYKLEEMMAEMSHNEKLPSERDLSVQFSMSRMTVRKAMDVLISQNKVYAIPSVGVFTADKRLYKSMTDLVGFTKEVETQGGVVSNDLVEFRLMHANQTIANKLEINEGDDVYKVVRLRKKNNVPLILDEAYFPKAIIPLSKEEAKGSIYHYIQTTLGLKPAEAKQYIKAVFVNQTYADCLEVDTKTPLLYVEITARLEDGRVYEFTRSYKNSESYDLVIESRVI